VTLVALRLGVGLHFLQEGIKKFVDPTPYTAGFLGNAKGPLAPLFQAMIWDPDGVARLDLPATEKAWDEYRERVVRFYGFDERQSELARRVFDRRRDQLRWVIETNASDLQQYAEGLKRVDQYRQDPARMSVASLQGQVSKIERELWSTRGRVLPQIDGLWADYERDLARLATAEQQSRGSLPLTRLGRRTLDSESIDVLVRYMDVTLGLLLISGLFTRFAAIWAAAFLCSVIASQWPGAPGAVAVWPQLIEMLALLVVAAAGAGRFAGLDFVLGTLRGWWLPARLQGTRA
jgi:uncharacterized membrane protein YphA (DoxX/SURF4 family)